MADSAFFNGDYCSLDSIQLSPLDRGFLFGDGVYEVIPIYEQWALGLEQHVQRLDNSLRALEINTPYNQTEWRNVIQRLAQSLNLSAGERGAVYLQVSRGVDAVRKHLPTKPLDATVFAYAHPVDALVPDVRQQGVAAATHADQRWGRCDIKATALLGHVMHRLQAQQVDETLLLADGVVREGASSNVFVVNDGRIATPPVSEHILAGVTRRLVIEQLAAVDIAVTERPVTEDELRSADEIWITSSTREIYPVTLLDDVIVGQATYRQPGPYWHIARGCYQDYIGKTLEKDEAQTLLDLPCSFPLKVFGKQHDSFPNTVRDIVAQHVPACFIGSTESKPSANGKYLAVTVNFTAHSKAQLDALYQDISACPDVVMAL